MYIGNMYIYMYAFFLPKERIQKLHIQAAKGNTKRFNF